MAAGRPVIASVDLDSDTATAIREARCGSIVQPGDAGALAKEILAMVDAQGASAQGTNARRYFERTYARDAAIAQMERILDDAVGRRRR